MKGVTLTEKDVKQMADNMAKLPPVCYYVHIITHDTIKIVRGESGYYLPHPSTLNGKDYKTLNKELGVTERQAHAMGQGSMMGWHIPAADPDCYVNDPKRNMGLHDGD